MRQMSKQLCGVTSKFPPGSEYHRLSTITTYREQWGRNAPAYFSTEWIRDNTQSGERECLCLCINISDLNRCAPRARQQSIVNHTLGHLALSCTHNKADFLLEHKNTCTRTHDAH